MGQRAFPSDTYALVWRAMDSDVEYPAGMVDPTELETRPAFKASSVGVPEGWYLLLAIGTAGETCIPQPVYINRGDPDPVSRPTVSATYDVFGYGWQQYTVTWAPADPKPYTQALPHRPTTPFSDLLKRKDLFERDIAPRDHGARHLPRVTLAKGGKRIVHDAQQQDYYFDTVEAEDYPARPQVTGPRGQATLAQPNDLHVGRSAWGFLTSWNASVVSFSTGAVRPLFGWFHDWPAPLLPKNATKAEVLASLRPVGDWGTIKPGLNGLVDANLDRPEPRAERDPACVQFRAQL